MELDLHDAIRLNLVVEISADGIRRKIEPYELAPTASGQVMLRAFDLSGTPEWKAFCDWSELKITNVRFSPRAVPIEE